MYHLMYFYGVTLGFWEGKQIIAARGVIETIPSIFISSPLKADQACVLVLSQLKQLPFRANPRFLHFDLVTSVPSLYVEL